MIAQVAHFHLLVDTLGILLLDAAIKVLFEPLDTGHFHGIPEGLPPLGQVPRSAGIVEPTDQPLNGVANHIDVYGPGLVQMGKVYEGHVLRVGVGRCTVQDVGVDKVLGVGVVHYDHFVQSLDIAAGLEVIARGQDLEQLHHLLAAGLSDAVEEYRFQLSPRGVVQLSGGQVG